MPAAVFRLLQPVAYALVVFVVLFWRLGEPSFWDPDEAHYAESSREMMASGDWWAPYYNEQPFFDKPVLFHQLQGAAMAALGPTETAARLVPALAGLLIVLTTAWLGSTLLSRDVGLLAALLMATSPGLFGLARYAILDTLFTAFAFGGAALVTVSALQNRPGLQYPGYLLVAFAVLTKGPLGLVLCGLAFLLAIAVSSDARRRLLGLHWVAGLGAVLVVAGPWFLYMYWRFRDAFVSGYVLDENLRLFATDRFKYQPGVGFYLPILATAMLPWTGLLLGRLVDDLRSAWARRLPDTVEVFLWAWVAAIVGFFSLSRFKLDHYVFPVAPALCLLCARAWYDVRARPVALEHRATLVGAQLVGPLLAVIGLVAGYLMAARLELPWAAGIVPVGLILAGAIVTAGTLRRERVIAGAPWLVVGALVLTYAGVIVWVLPVLEDQKVVPDLARWVASEARPEDRIGATGLNRWNTSFRFYVDRHVDVLDTAPQVELFFAAPGNFYCAMLEPAYEELVRRGTPLRIVMRREGMWATSGKALWRSGVAPTPFVIVTRK